jgi:tetratricopeptide (TPR) repeat protein
MTTTAPSFVNYYEMLGLPRTAATEQIKEKIKEELRIWRKRQGLPDLSKRQEAELRMQHLAAARDVLLDAGKRGEYDRTLDQQRMNTPQARTAPSGRDWVSLAEEYLAQNDYHSATYAAREATQNEGNSARAWNLRARANAGLGNLQDASYEARQAAEIEPANAQFQFDLGGVLEQQQRWPEALTAYEASARLEPANFIYPLSIAGVYLQNNAPERAMPILEQVAGRHPDEEMVNFYLANGLHDLAEHVPASRSGDIYMITTQEEIGRMEALLTRAMSLRHGDRDLQAQLKQTLDYVESCKQTKFSVPPALFAFGLRGVVAAFVLPVLMFFSSFSLMRSSPGGGFLVLLISAACIFGLIKACWVPVWKRNRRAR